MPATLYLLPSSLGAASSEWYLPNEVVRILHRLTLFFTEDLRTGRRFIKSTGFTGNISDLDFYELSEHTSPAETEQLLTKLIEHGEAGLLSEAGLPAVADPGSLLVHLCHRHGIRVVPLTGPSSVMLALMASGLNGQHFTFHGYLPRETAQRRKKIRELEQEAVSTGYSQIFMETPYRNRALIQDLLQTCRKSSWLCVAAGLTTPEEKIKTLKIEEWKKVSEDFHKIPAIFILGQPG